MCKNLYYVTEGLIFINTYIFCVHELILNFQVRGVVEESLP